MSKSLMGLEQHEGEKLMTIQAESSIPAYDVGVAYAPVNSDKRNFSYVEASRIYTRTHHFKEVVDCDFIFFALVSVQCCSLSINNICKDTKLNFNANGDIVAFKNNSVSKSMRKQQTNMPLRSVFTQVLHNPLD